MSVAGWRHYYEFWAYPGDLHVTSWAYDIKNAKHWADAPEKLCVDRFENTMDQGREFSTKCDA